MNMSVAREKPKLCPEKWYEEVVQKKNTSVFTIKSQMFFHLQKIDPALVGKRRYKKPDYLIMEVVLVVYLKGIYFVSQVYFRKDIKLLKPRLELLERKIYEESLKKKSFIQKKEKSQKPVKIKILSPKISPEKALKTELEKLKFSPKLEKFLLETFLLDGIKKFKIDPEGNFTITYKSKKMGTIKDSENQCLNGAKVTRDKKITGTLANEGFNNMKGLSFDNTYLGLNFNIGVGGVVKQGDRYNLIPDDLKSYYSLDPRRAVSSQLFTFLSGWAFSDKILIKWLNIKWD